MKLGFFGGSFNPPHNGHKKIIKNCVNHFNKCLIIPNKVSPDKIQKSSINSLHRIEMLNLLFDKDKVEIDLFEINSKDDISYTCNTIKYLKDKYYDFSLTMILGEDQLVDLKEWYNYEYIIKNVNIFCFKRFTEKALVSNKKKIKNIIKKDLDNFNNTLKSFEYDCHFSSTEIRDKIKFKQSIAKNMISEKVMAYIKDNNLYK